MVYRIEIKKILHKQVKYLLAARSIFEIIREWRSIDDAFEGFFRGMKEEEKNEICEAMRTYFRTFRIYHENN